MTIRDLTEQQMVELTSYTYHFDENVELSIKYRYQAYDASMYEDAAEYVDITFDGYALGNTRLYPLRFRIYSNLDFYLSYQDVWKETDSNVYPVWKNVPCRNYLKIFKRLDEIGIEPVYHE